MTVNPDVSNLPPVNFCASPARIILRDVFLVLRQLHLVPPIVLPIYRSGNNVANSGAILQVVAFLARLITTGLWIAAVFLGFPMPWVAFAVSYVIVNAVVIPQGKVIIPSRISEVGFRRRGVVLVSPVDLSLYLLSSYSTILLSSYLAIFVKYELTPLLCYSINGVATATSGFRLGIATLQNTFHRPVTANNNRIMSLWFDCARVFRSAGSLRPTQDMREEYKELCKAILNDNKTRVVLIAHSQDGILAAQWMDQLLADFPASKATGNRERPFGYIEHFATERDFVAQIGVLAYSNRPTNASLAAAHSEMQTVQARYAGRVSFRAGHTGHLFLSHYLHDGDSILQDPFVRSKSQLVKYIRGGKR